MADSPLADVGLHLVESIDDLWEMKRWAGERRETPLCFDTETTGLNPSKDKIRLLQLGDMRHGWAIPFEGWGGGGLEILRDYEGELAGHNASFDWRFLKVHGKLEIPWHKLHDTMTLARLDDPTRAAGLKPLSNILVDRHANSGEHALHEGMKKNGWTWATVPINYPAYWAYGALDGVLTAHIWSKLHPRVMARSPELYDLEMGVLRICAKMMLKGMKVDRPYIRSQIRRLKGYSEQVREWLQQYHEVTSPMAAKQIASALGAVGFQVTDFTATGQPRVDKEVLETIADSPSPDIPEAAKQLAKAILKVRHADKVVGTYLENFLGLADHDDVIHAHIWPLQAKTGRMSVTDPALQTLHRDDKVVRGAFVPREGHHFISADASQIEMRLAAHLSRDEGLIALFKAADEGGADIYSGIASELFGEPVGKGDPRRQATKSMSYTKIYGGGIGKMALVVGLPYAQVKPIYDAFNTRFPGLENLSRAIESRAKAQIAAGERPHVLTEMGRYLPCEPTRIYALVNYLIQSTAAEVLKRGLLNLEAAGLGDYLCIPIHDEIILEPEAEQSGEMLRLVLDTLYEGTRYRVPIPWDAKVMKERWLKG